MSEYPQAVIWLTHDQARIVEIAESHGRATELLNSDGTIAADQSSFANRRDMAAFFDQVAESCGTADQLLLLGRETITHNFQKHLRSSRPPLASRVVGCAPGTRPTDREMLDFGRTFFRLVQQANGSAPVERRDAPERRDVDQPRPKFCGTLSPQPIAPTFGLTSATRPARVLPAGRWSRPGTGRD